LKSSYISLYFDEDVSVKIAFNLRHRGFDVLTTIEAKNLGATDEGQLSYAVRTARVLITHNLRHFLDLHKKYLSAGKTHNGIVLIVRQKNPYRIVSRLLQFIHNTSSKEMLNQLHYL